MKYLVKTPALIQRWVYPGFTWRLPAGEKNIYLSFDDGPHPHITSFVLDELKKYDAAATFFCTGINVETYPDLYKRLLLEGHAVGNHTYEHLNGWKADDADYFRDIGKAAKLIDSTLFRPPYGRITRFQASQLRERLGYHIIMWTVLSGDFDRSILPEKCLSNVVKHAGDGSIIVFHDSEKAWDRMQYALPRALEQLSSRGYRFRKITGDGLR